MNPLLPYFIAITCIVLLLVYLAYRFFKRARQYEEEVNQLRQAYAPIIDIDETVAKREKIWHDLLSDTDKLRQDYAEKRRLFDALLAEIRLYENHLEDISYGLYTPVYHFDTSEQYKQKLESIRQHQKAMIEQETAVLCHVEWTVGGSRTEGRRLTKQYGKLMLRAFNGESDAAVARVSWNNIVTMENRLRKAYDAINKLASVQQATINAKYLDLKIAELRLEHELQEKIQAEKEEQRLIREQMREEERAQRELEMAQRKAEDEELRYQKALIKARQEMEQATGEKLSGLTDKIQQLETALEAARQQKERALSMAQMTRSGHVYIISNIGSFGEDVFKIGMTRRLEPLDRVRELGDASVPFSFDVHGLVYSDNAPDLENTLHKKLAEHKVNLVNDRREFFRVPIEQIEQILDECGLSLTLTKLAEAREYRESLSIRAVARQKQESKAPVTNPFPEILA